MGFNELLNKLDNFDNISNFEITETFTLFKIVQTYNNLPNLDIFLLKLISNSVNLRDTLSLVSISFGDCEPVLLYNNNYQDFIEEIQLNNSFAGSNVNISFKIEISKSSINNTISIYDLDSFAKYLDSLTLSQIIYNLNNIRKNEFFYFETQNTNISNISYTNFLCFKPINNPFQKVFKDYYFNIKKRKSICNFLNNEIFDFEPINFYLSHSINTKLDSLFSRLKITYSLISIFDISQIENNTLNIKINGYKSSEFSIDFNNIDILKTSIYYDIYKWIYTDESKMSDKVTLARNIISLYLVNSNDINLDSSAFEAIQSNYSIYLKENVEKYLELKSKIIENQQSINKSISNLSTTITDGFLKNLSAIGTFTITILIMNSFNEKKFTNIFTKDVSVLFLGLIIISAIYLFYTIHETRYKLKNLIVNYYRFKHSYDDILLKQDLKRIFKKDKLFKKDIRNIKAKIKFYTFIWLLTLFVLFGILLILGYSHFYNFIQILIKYFSL